MTAEFRLTRAGKRVASFFRRRRGNPPGSPGDDRIPYSKWLGFHADEDNGLESPLLVTKPVELMDLNPATNMNGAMCLWRHLTPGNHTTMLDQRAQAAAYFCESPTIIMIPFTTASPGSDDPVTRAAQEAAALADLPGQLALYAAEDPIFGIGNLNADNYMPAALPAARNAAWFAFEAKAIKIVSDAGYRWCSTDDLGLVSLCNNIVARRAAWVVEGLDPDDCEFCCVHVYVVSGFVPSMMLYADASFARAGVATPIRVTEGAFGFLGSGFTDADKPWLFTEYEVGNSFGYPPHSLRWTRYLLQWFRTQGRHFLLFDWTMMVRMVAGTPTATSWGTIFIEDQHSQPVFVSPGAAGGLWHDPDAEVKVYQVAASNGGDTGYAQDAADWVAAGHLFSMAP